MKSLTKRIIAALSLGVVSFAAHAAIPKNPSGWSCHMPPVVPPIPLHVHWLMSGGKNWAPQ